MGDLTRSISRYEIECPCHCEMDTIDYELIDVAQGCVDHFQEINPSYNVGIHINSGNRCPEYNKSIGGADNSKHTKWRAIDFFLYNKKTGTYQTAVTIRDELVADYLEKTYPDKYGVGRYVGRTHLDSRPVKARWNKR